MEERAPQHAGGGEVEVGVVEHDVRRLAAELERHLLHGARRELHDAPADLGRTGERDLVDERVLRQLFAGAAAGAGDEVDDAGRDVGLLRTTFTISTAVSDVKLAGFSTDAVAGRDRGAIFQPAMRNGKFHGTMPVHTPNGSYAHEALRRRERALARGRSTSGSFSAQLGEQLERRRRARDVGEHRLLDRAATVARLDLGDLGLRALMISATLRSFSARSLPDIFGHGPSSNALRAALMAACASSRPALATSAIFSPVDGS